MAWVAGGWRHASLAREKMVARVKTLLGRQPSKRAPRFKADLQLHAAGRTAKSSTFVKNSNILGQFLLGVRRLKETAGCRRSSVD